MKKKRFKLKRDFILIIIGIIILTGVIGYFSKESYCNPKGYLPYNEEGINSKQVQSFLGSSSGDVLCTGADEMINKILSGRTSYILCKANSEGQYSIEITRINAVKMTSIEVSTWIKDRSWEGAASSIAIFPIEIPKGINEESLRLELIIRKNGQLVSRQNLNFEIYNPEDLMDKICIS